MSKMRLMPIVALLAFGMGCDLLNGIMGTPDGPEITADAEALLKSSDLPAAHDKYLEIYAANQSSVYAASGLAYSHVLRGEYDKAENLLVAIDNDQLDPGLVSDVKLRRTLVAWHQKDFDQVKSLGEASGTPTGKLMAGEAHLADANPNGAIPLFEDASKDGGVVGETAKTYLSYMRDDDGKLRSLAEASALWSIGEYGAACESAQFALEALDEEYAQRNEMALLWAGRAATMGPVESAEQMLEFISVPPVGQEWRIPATQALVHFRNEEYDDGIALFNMLATGGAPADGLADALATAVSLTKDPEKAKEISSGLESNAAARGLLEVGEAGAAKSAAPSGSLKRYLESQ